MSPILEHPCILLLGEASYAIYIIQAIPRQILTTLAAGGYHFAGTGWPVLARLQQWPPQSYCTSTSRCRRTGFAGQSSGVSRHNRPFVMASTGADCSGWAGLLGGPAVEEIRPLTVVLDKQARAKGLLVGEQQALPLGVRPDPVRLPDERRAH